MKKLFNVRLLSKEDCSCIGEFIVALHLRTTWIALLFGFSKQDFQNMAKKYHRSVKRDEWIALSCNRRNCREKSTIYKCWKLHQLNASKDDHSGSSSVSKFLGRFLINSKDNNMTSISSSILFNFQPCLRFQTGLIKNILKGPFLRYYAVLHLPSHFCNFLFSNVQ